MGVTEPWHYIALIKVTTRLRFCRRKPIASLAARLSCIYTSNLGPIGRLVISRVFDQVLWVNHVIDFSVINPIKESNGPSLERPVSDIASFVALQV